MAPIDRRTFLASAGAMLVVPRLGGARVRYAANPFSLGVASGDPTADAVILWTRLAPDPIVGGMPAEPVEVAWEVAHDERFTRPVRSGRMTARPESAHTVHVDVTGLDPDRGYFYRFHTTGAGGSIESPTGRTRTAPRPDATPDRFRFAFASCQKYDEGFYTAHRHLADEDLQMLLFLGDYIYEGPAEQDGARPHALPEATTLDDYRRRYALYRQDADLQRAHAAFPWMLVWDDHELFNDYVAAAVARDPVQRARQQAAYQAFAEHMPIRARLTPGTATLQMYRGLPIGSLATLCLLDTRQYRDRRVCGEGLVHPCADLTAPGRSMLGSVQEQWLHDTLRRSPTRWQVIAQQIPFARVDREPGAGVSLHMDKWDGYPEALERLLDILAARNRHDTMVLTGDNHNHWVMELKRTTDRDGADPVTHELVSTSISSTGDGFEQREPYKSALPDNPHARYFNSRRGYVRCEITAAEWRSDFRVVPYVSRPGAPVTTDATFVLRHGASRIERA